MALPPVGRAGSPEELGLDADDILMDGEELFLRPDKDRNCVGIIAATIH